MNGIKNAVNYFREAMIEIRKVSWPSKEHVINDTIVVIIGSALVSVYLGLLDFGIDRAINILLQKF